MSRHGRSPPPLRVFGALTRSLTSVWADAGVLALITGTLVLLCVLAMIALTSLLAAHLLPLAAMDALAGLVACIVALAGFGAIMHVTGERAEGRRPRLRAALRSGFGSSMAALAAAAVILVALDLGFVALAAAAFHIGVRFAPDAAALAFFGLLACTAPFAYALMQLALAVVVAERCGAFGAIRRTLEITRGNRLRIVAVLGLSWLGWEACLVLASAALGGPERHAVAFFAAYAVLILGSYLQTSLAVAVLYRDLRAGLAGPPPAA